MITIAALVLLTANTKWCISMEECVFFNCGKTYLHLTIWAVFKLRGVRHIHVAMPLFTANGNCPH